MTMDETWGRKSQNMKLSLRSTACPVCVKECVSPSVMSNSLRPHGPTRLLCQWDFPGKNTGVGCHFLLQGIILTQG